MYALIELDHGDYGAVFETRDEADAALARIAMLTDEPGEFGVFELDERGFPVDPHPAEDARA